MSPSDNQLVPLLPSRGQAVIAQKSTQSRQGAKSQSQTRPEFLAKFKPIPSVSKRFKPKKRKSYMCLFRSICVHLCQSVARTPLNNARKHLEPMALLKALC
jgi:hypothetical protein